MHKNSLSKQLSGKQGNRNLFSRFVIVLALVFAISPILALAEVHPLFEEGLEQYQQGHYDDAYNSFNKIIEAYPERKEGYYNRGLCLYQSEQYDHALSDFEQCLQMDSCFGEARWMKSLCLYQNGEIKASINALRNTPACDPDNPAGDKNNLAGKRIKLYLLAVYVSKNWYYMIALMFMVIILMAVVIKLAAYRK